jgi:predicted nucleic acid-binding protein
LPCLIDTNVAIHLRDGDRAIQQKIDSLRDTIVLSIISRVELEGGIWRDPALAAERRARLDLLFAAMPILPFDAAAADIYRTIVETAGYSRRKLLDRMIASQAMVHRAKLVTMNAADFNDILGLEVIAW